MQGRYTDTKTDGLFQPTYWVEGFLYSLTRRIIFTSSICSRKRVCIFEFLRYRVQNSFLQGMFGVHYLSSLVAISGLKKVSIFRAHPFQWALVIDVGRIKIITSRAI